MNRLSKALLLATLLALSSPSVSAQTGPDRTCSSDTTAWLQQQVTTAVMSGVAHTGGRLNIAGGCYRVDGTVTVQRSDFPDQGYGLIMLGDGPGSTIIRGPHPLVFHQISGGEIGEFSLEGSNQFADNGIAFNRAAADLGSCCFTIHDVRVSQYGNCFMFGDVNAPYGAAADWVGYSLTANTCNVGYRVGGNWNNLDGNCTRCSVSFSYWGWYGCGGAGCGTQMHIIGGGGTGNVSDFYAAEGDWLIEGWRSEGHKSSTAPRVIVGGGGSTIFTMENSTFLAGKNDAGQYVITPVAVDTSSGGAGNSYHLYNNALPGRIKMGPGSLDARGNHIYGTPDAFEIVSPSTTRARTIDNCKTPNPNGICSLPTAWWPDRP